MCGGVVRRVAIVGCGTLGRAVLKGLQEVACGLEVVAVSTRKEETCRRLAEDCGVVATTDNKEAVKNAEVVLLAVKPSTVASVLGEEGMPAALAGRTLVSVAAGITTEQKTRTPTTDIRSPTETVGDASSSRSRAESSISSSRRA